MVITLAGTKLSVEDFHEAVGILRPVTKSEHSVIARLDLGEMALEFASREPGTLRQSLDRYVGKKVVILWFTDPASGDTVVKIRPVE